VKKHAQIFTKFCSVIKRGFWLKKIQLVTVSNQLNLKVRDQNPITINKGAVYMKKINLGNVSKVHFIGIGGISMSGLAEVLSRDGYEVTGSDDVKSAITDHLQKTGITVHIPNRAENISSEIDLVVYTAAVKENNPEYRAAVANGKILIERAALLGFILKGYDNAICVAGTHGKTSTTSLMAEILIEAALDPTISIGGHMGRDGTNYRVGESSYFLLESCEYSNSFHHWHPQVGIILNVEADHLDFFGDFEGVVQSFKKFAQNIRPGGTLVVHDSVPEEITQNLPCKVVTFGLQPMGNSHFWASNIEFSSLGCAKFDVMAGAEKLTTITLPIPGRYNMLNALAAFAAAYKLGIAPNVIALAVSNTKGVKRRFEYKGMYNGATIIDDYAHHPTEIKECLAAAKNSSAKKIICLFQSHTYSRTKNLLNEFAESFADADEIVVLPIFASRETFDPTISSLDLVEGIRRNGKNTIHMDNFDEARKYLQEKLMPNDMLITMGAGDVYFVGEMILST